jgi:hypothetical protein
VLINDSSKGTRHRNKQQINNPSQDFDLLAGDFELARDPPRLDDLLRAIDIGKEQLEGFHPLHEAGFEKGPFRAQHHAGNDIERDQALDSVLFAIGDADPAKQQLRLRTARSRSPAGVAASQLAILP